MTLNRDSQSGEDVALEDASLLRPVVHELAGAVGPGLEREVPHVGQVHAAHEHRSNIHGRLELGRRRVGSFHGRLELGRVELTRAGRSMHSRLLLALALDPPHAVRSRGPNMKHKCLSQNGYG